jgi:hypothetical protein
MPRRSRSSIERASELLIVAPATILTTNAPQILKRLLRIPNLSRQSRELASAKSSADPQFSEFVIPSCPNPQSKKILSRF